MIVQIEVNKALAEIVRGKEPFRNLELDFFVLELMKRKTLAFLLLLL